METDRKLILSKTNGLRGVIQLGSRKNYMLGGRGRRGWKGIKIIHPKCQGKAVGGVKLSRCSREMNSAIRLRIGEERGGVIRTSFPG